MPEIAQYFHNHNVTNIVFVSKTPDTNLARGLNCLERHQSDKPHKQPWLHVGIRKLLEEVVGLVQTTQRMSSALQLGNAVKTSKDI